MDRGILGVAWYRREDYGQLLGTFSDGRGMPESYDDWLQTAELLISELALHGHAVRKVCIDPDVFCIWCSRKGLVPDSTARTRFVIESISGT